MPKHKSPNLALLTSLKLSKTCGFLDPESQKSLLQPLEQKLKLKKNPHTFCYPPKNPSPGVLRTVRWPKPAHVALDWRIPLRKAREVAVDADKKVVQVVRIIGSSDAIDPVVNRADAAGIPGSSPRRGSDRFGKRTTKNP